MRSAAGSHPGLMNYAPIPRAIKYDTIMLSYMTNRRLQMATWFAEKGLSIAPNGWHEKRHERLMQSRLMLHIHQNDRRYIAPQRWALAAAYKLPLISELLDNTGDFAPTHFLQSEYGNIPRFVKYWVTEKTDDLQRYGEILHQFLCFDRTFRREVMRNV